MTDIQQIIFKKNDENETIGYPITKGECIEDIDSNSDFKQVKDDTNKLKEDLGDKAFRLNEIINLEDIVEVGAMTVNILGYTPKFNPDVTAYRYFQINVTVGEYYRIEINKSSGQTGYYIALQNSSDIVIGRYILNLEGNANVKESVIFQIPAGCTKISAHSYVLDDLSGNFKCEKLDVYDINTRINAVNVINPEIFKDKNDEDDTKSIQRAIDYCSESEVYGCVQLMNKTYIISSPLKLKNNVSIRGYCPVTEYSNATILKNINSDFFDLTEDVQMVTISNIEFRGEYYTYQNNVFSGNASLKYSKIFDCAFTQMYRVFNNTNLIGCTIERIMIDSVIDVGIVTGSDCYLYKWFLALSKIYENYENIYMFEIQLRASYIDSLYFTACQPRNPTLGTKRMLKLSNCTSCVVSRCNFTYSQESLLDIKNCRDLIITNNMFAGFGASRDNMFAIYVTSPENVIITNNNFDKSDKWEWNDSCVSYIGIGKLMICNNNYYNKPTFQYMTSDTSEKNAIVNEPSYGINLISYTNNPIISDDGILSNFTIGTIVKYSKDIFKDITAHSGYINYVIIFFENECMCSENIITNTTTVKGYVKFKKYNGKWYQFN